MKRICLMTAILIAGTSLTACNDANQQRAEATMNSAEEMADTAGDRIENAVDNTVAAITPAPSPQEFVNRAAKSDAFEIAAAKLAAKNAASADVKAFAAEMIKAHTDSTAKIKTAAAAAQPAITPDPALTAEQNEDLAELGRLTGAQFDEDYMDGQVDAHEDALALMRAYASGGEVASLKAAAGEIAPVVESHLKMARDLDARTDI